MPITGGCLCGKVRYTITAEPIMTRLCWCRVCQYLAAGNAAVNVCFPTAAATVSGELKDYVCLAESGNVMRRAFCPTCGTAVTSQAEVRPHLLFIRAGTLDDASLAKPVANIWAKSAPPWACLDERMERFEAQPPPPVAK